MLISKTWGKVSISARTLKHKRARSSGCWRDGYERNADHAKKVHRGRTGQDLRRTEKEGRGDRTEDVKGEEEIVEDEDEGQRSKQENQTNFLRVLR